jgi:hypothetical protein
MPKPNLTGSTRIDINGNTGWLLGANLPWIKCAIDFGESAWGAFGIGSTHQPANGAPLSSQELRNTFATMQAAGVNVARWFLFVDGRAGIIYDGSGSPNGLDAVIMGGFRCSDRNCKGVWHQDHVRADFIRLDV